MFVLFVILIGMLFILLFNYFGGEVFLYFVIFLVELLFISLGEVVFIYVDVFFCMMGVIFFGFFFVVGLVFLKLELDGGLIFYEKGSWGKGVVIKVDKMEDEGDLV